MEVRNCGGFVRHGGRRNKLEEVDCARLWGGPGKRWRYKGDAMVKRAARIGAAKVSSGGEGKNLGSRPYV